MTNKQQTIELLPCPFCGEAPILASGYNIEGAYISCTNQECCCMPQSDATATSNSDGSLNIDEAIGEVIEAWNTRATDKHLPALVEALEEISRWADRNYTQRLGDIAKKTLAALPPELRNN
ncbi:Lar family restriction alleviation protein [uncultured Paraglaciecola sp.]|uniref:Lar family restriction alleviation protein n=1 Tax=uncultured Paraglaciecola sp. TaxID=1765024 RepID=UPI00262ABCAA|nr:Lar family restriction alleviation protein [uncultured Paraglaciecola sp.]